MGNIDITMVIELVAVIIGTVITYVVIPYIKSKTTANQFAYLESIVKAAVFGAEVILDGDGRGEEKRRYVINHVKSVCEQSGITFDSNEIDQMIEKSWLELTELMQGLSKNET